MRERSDEQLLALVVVGRGGSDPEAAATARRAWQELVVRDIDRVRGIVAAWRLPGHDVRVDQQERDDAVQYAYLRLVKMLPTFRGDAMGQYRAAMATCVDYACRDYCRSKMRREMGIGGSLDERLPGADADGPGRFDRVIAALSEHGEDERAEGRMALDAIARAIDELPNENMKAVLRLSLEGFASKEIAERLDLTPANVDQLRSRALRRLTPEISEPAGA